MQKRPTIVHILLFIFLSIVIKAEATSITIEHRVSGTLALKQIYWKHTIWPDQNSLPKPSIDTVLPYSQLVFETRDYLRKSAALDLYWHKRITPELIQTEINRMARETKDPQLLQDLWGALGNDPYLIAECLARPLLVDRFTQQTRGFDAWWTLHKKHMSVEINAPAHAYHLPSLNVNTLQPAAFDTWTSTKTTGAPSGRDSHTAIWTGTQMIIWGGDDSSKGLRTGGRFTPATNSWVSTTTTGAPAARSFHSALWTGTEMIVWGGNEFRGKDLKTGGRYNPLTNKWAAVTISGAPAERSSHSAVWTGTEMIVWGGYRSDDFTQFKTGGRYNPSENSWIATSTTGCPSARFLHTAVWAGNQMIIWGGRNNSKDVKTGGRYTPATNTWTPTNTTGAPSARSIHTAVWTGSRMIVWGGYNSGGTANINTGAEYNPTTNSWKPLSTLGAPSPRDMHTAVWTGTVMIVWGGFDFNFLSGSYHLNTGGKYNPSTNSWLHTTITGAPAGREIHTAIWTGKQMIVWGGTDGSQDINTGGRYTP